MPTQPITARELALYNWITVDGEKLQVCGIFHTGITIQRVDKNGVAQDFEDVIIESAYGIPLTPEWLERFGAKHIEHNWDYELKVSALSIKFRFSGSRCYSEVGDIYMGDRISFVHVLQNIAHSLTGQELTPNK